MAMNDFDKHDTSVASALKVCLALFGDPTSQDANEVRWGTNGSKKLILTGEYAGQFNDFEADQKGNYFSVVKWYGNGQPIWKQLDEIGVPRVDIVGGRFQNHKWIKGRPIKEETKYRYFDENGEHQYTVTRFDFADGPGKTFANDRKQKGKKPLLYNLPALLMHPDEIVFIVEGEKNVETMRNYGLLAVTNDGGAKHWQQSFGSYFRNRAVVIVEDNDEPGRAWVRDVYDSVEPQAESISFVHFHDKEPKHDATDFLLDNSRDEFLLRIGEFKNFDGELELEAEFEEEQPKPRRFPLLSVDDLQNRPPPTWLIDSFICEGELAVIFGPPAQGKTFLSLDMALHMATGRNWHGFETKKRRVLYIAGEGVAGLSGRVQAWLLHHSYGGFKDFMVLPEAVNFLDRSELEVLKLTIDELDEPFDVIFIDTVSRAMSGGDENSAEVMSTFIAHCGALQKAYGATVIGVHHSGKDATKGLRGSSALLGAVTSSLSVTKVADQVKLTSEKQKDIELPEPLQFDMVPVEIGEGLLANSSVILELAAIIKDDRTGRRVSPNEKIVIDALHDAINTVGRYSRDQGVPGHQKTVTLEQWRTQAGEKLNMGSKAWYATFKRAATRLIANGFIAKKGDEHWPA